MSILLLTRLLAGTVALLLLVLAAMWRVATTRVRELSGSLVLAQEQLEGAARAVAELARDTDTAQQVATRAQQHALDFAQKATLHERRASEFFGIIAGVEKERDLWQKLYRESSQQAGVAQAWLIRDMGRAIQTGNLYAQRLREKGEKAPSIGVDAALKHVVEEFAGTHAVGHPEIQSTDAVARAKEVDESLPIPRSQG